MKLCALASPCSAVSFALTARSHHAHAMRAKHVHGHGSAAVPTQKAAQLQGQMMAQNGMFPGSVSNASLGNLLASSNRLSSLLSLNSFLSRDPSLADLAMMPNGAQLAALQQQSQQGMARNLNNNQGAGAVAQPPPAPASS